MPLKFRRVEPGHYVAQDQTKRYTVWRDGSFWSLAVQELVETAGVKHALGQPPICRGMHDTKKLCADVASAYSALGDDYKPHEHGHRGRMTEAVQHAYDADKAATA